MPYCDFGQILRLSISSVSDVCHIRIFKFAVEYIICVIAAINASLSTAKGYIQIVEEVLSLFERWGGGLDDKLHLESEL
ncbi:TPA: hypothetical protein I7743_03755 [Vibrio vulnificus]|nr:hypothetical protein [Vibrio vulnificus]